MKFWWPIIYLMVMFEQLAGEWAFHFHTRASSSQGTTTLRFEIFKRSSVGVETVLFSKSSNDINNSTFDLSTILVTQPFYSVAETDRIGIKVYANTTRTSNVTVDLAVGDGNAMYFTTPLEIRHNQLRARDESDAHPISSITGLQTALDNKVDDSEKGSANGVATLDVNGKVVLTQIPDSILGQLEYMGTHNFTTLPIATQKGQYWIASADGNGYITGDRAVWNGTSFDKVDNTDAVATVAGRTGNVVLTKNDVGLGNVTNESKDTMFASPTFTGTVTLPSSTSIGTISSTALGYINGVTSPIQTQIGNKAPLASPALTGIPTAPTASVGTNTTQIATTAFVKAASNPINSLRADRYLALQNIANMVYTSGDLTKIQYNNSTDVDYEVLSYSGGNLSTIQHYVGSVLRGTTTLSYTSGNLVSAIFV